MKEKETSQYSLIDKSDSSSLFGRYLQLELEKKRQYVENSTIDLRQLLKRATNAVRRDLSKVRYPVRSSRDERSKETGKSKYEGLLQLNISERRSRDFSLCEKVSCLRKFHQATSTGT